MAPIPISPAAPPPSPERTAARMATIGIHGLRQRRPYSRQYAPDRPLTQLQPTAQYLHSVREQHGRPEDNGQRDSELESYRQRDPLCIRKRDGTAAESIGEFRAPRC